MQSCVNELESHETNSFSYEDIEPSSSPSGHLQILGDLVACSSSTTVMKQRGTSRMWNGMTEWKMVNVHSNS